MPLTSRIVIVRGSRRVYYGWWDGASPYLVVLGTNDNPKDTTAAKVAMIRAAVTAKWPMVAITEVASTTLIDHDDAINRDLVPAVDAGGTTADKRAMDAYLRRLKAAGSQ